MRSLIQYILLALLLLLVQVLVLNNIHLGNIATPFLYIWLILKLPNEMSRPLVITTGFLVGLVVDLFANTPGMHAFATSLLAYMKEPMMVLYVPREDIKTGVASVKLMGMGGYLRFLATAVLLFCTTIYVIEAFTFFNLGLMALKILTSAVLTFLLIAGVDGLRPGVAAGKQQ
jgi:rod shape-determining protein MreD